MSIPSISDKQTRENLWSMTAPYVIPPVAASVAIIFAFKDMVAKSALQKGLPLPTMTILESFKQGLKAAPTVGVIVGTQMILQGIIAKSLTGETKDENLFTTLASSAIIGISSAPILAVFNGQTMGLSVKKTLQNFTVKQGMAISTQETAFVAGLSLADKLAEVMRRKFGNNKAIDYMAAYIAGVIGSLVGHPANTALTRWQSGMQVESLQQSMWGAARKARAVGTFSVVYKLGKETLNSTVNTNKE